MAVEWYIVQELIQYVNKVHRKLSLYTQEDMLIKSTQDKSNRYVIEQLIM